jgi:hypothetical protein
MSVVSMNKHTRNYSDQSHDNAQGMNSISENSYIEGEGNRDVYQSDLPIMDNQ